MSEPGMKRTVEEVRNDIDTVDNEIVGLLGRRAELAREIGSLKGDQNKPYFTPEREHQIFQRLAKIEAGPLKPAQVLSLIHI